MDLAMHYRVFFLNDDNRIAKVAEIACDTDEQAVAAAQETAAGRLIEIWRKHRRVGVFVPPEPATGS